MCCAVDKMQTLFAKIDIDIVEWKLKLIHAHVVECKLKLCTERKAIRQKESVSLFICTKTTYTHLLNKTAASTLK